MLLQSVSKEILHAQILVWPLDNIYSLASSLCKDTLKDIIFSCFSQIYFNPCRPQQMPFTQDLNEEIICFTLQKKKTVLQSQIYIISTYSSQDWKPSKNKVDVLFFSADICNSIHMKVHSCWLCIQTKYNTIHDRWIGSPP